MQDMPFHSRPVDRSLNTTASASGVDASVVLFPYIPFAGGVDASGIAWPVLPFAGDE